jgi:hypothetical protein
MTDIIISGTLEREKFIINLGVKSRQAKHLLILFLFILNLTYWHVGTHGAKFRTEYKKNSLMGQLS